MIQNIEQISYVLKNMDQGDRPKHLIDFDQWVCWQYEEYPDSKPKKRPINPKSGAKASVSDSETWADFWTAYRYQSDQSTETDGLGFVLTNDDPFVGIDLDNCVEPDGEVHEWAYEKVQSLECYTELSPSKTGLHTFVRGSKPVNGNRRGNVEVYETSHYLTVTGDYLDELPVVIENRQSELEALCNEYLAPNENQSVSNRKVPTTSLNLDDQELLEKMRNAKNGDKFARLWRGDISGYESQSEADGALVEILAWWTQKDKQRIDRLFRHSRLMRPKWDDKHWGDGRTYGEGTIDNIIEEMEGGDVYDPDYSRDERKFDLSSLSDGETNNDDESKFDLSSLDDNNESDYDLSSLETDADDESDTSSPASS